MTRTTVGRHTYLTTMPYQRVDKKNKVEPFDVKKYLNDYVKKCLTN